MVWRMKRRGQVTGFDLSKIRDPGKYLNTHARAMKAIAETLEWMKGQRTKRASASTPDPSAVAPMRPPARR